MKDVFLTRAQRVLSYHLITSTIIQYINLQSGFVLFMYRTPYANQHIQIQLSDTERFIYYRKYVLHLHVAFSSTDLR